MAKLYQLSWGKSKKKMEVIMIASLKDCQRYQRDRGKEGNYELIEAPEDAYEWKRKKLKGGYVSKHGNFQTFT